MNYRKQTRNACLAYSLLQLGRVDENAVQEYEALLHSNRYQASLDVVGGWLETYAPEVKEAWAHNPDLLHPIKAPRTGKGVAVIMGESPYFRQWHALSFEDGKVLDSDATVGQTETLAQVRKRWKAGGYNDVKLVALFPINK